MLKCDVELFKKLLNIYKVQNDTLTKAQKKSIKLQYASENWPINLHLDDDDLPLMLALEGNKDVELEPKKTIAERKRKVTGTR